MDITLTLTDRFHDRLEEHLFPGDGREAAAILLCGRRAGKERHRLLAREVHPIPHEACSERTPVRVTWPTDLIAPLLDRAEAEGWTVVKVHSHPGGCAAFSETDDAGDARLMPAIRDWIDGDFLHVSAIMLPGGRMFGRALLDDGRYVPLSHINIVGDDLYFWHTEPARAVPEFATSHAQAFGEGTFDRLSHLSIAVVGCSGTGSPVVEQLARLGVGELVLVDDDVIEERNINRILNATMDDVRAGRFKVDMLADAVRRMGIGTRVRPIPTSLWEPEAVRAVAGCHAVFGCMDTVDGRYLLNTLATFYLLPYIDIGVRLIAVPDGPRRGEIVEVCGSVHTLKPGGSSLLSRGLFDLKAVRDAGLVRTDPEAHAQQVKDGYIDGVAVRRPAIISLNMQLAALAANEFLARLHPFREEPNSAYDHVEVSLASMEMFWERHTDPCAILAGDVGKGDRRLLLDMPELSEAERP